jgi:uncharacterized protein (TIGR03067 family)
VGPAADARRIDLDMGPRVIRAVYRVDGDTLTMALPQDDQAARPTTFETPTGDRVVVSVFKRVKPKD